MTDSQQPHQYPPHEVYNGGYQPNMDMHSAQDPRQHVYPSQAVAQPPYPMVRKTLLLFRSPVRSKSFYCNKKATCRSLSSSTSKFGV